MKEENKIKLAILAGKLSNSYFMIYNGEEGVIHKKQFIKDMCQLFEDILNEQ